jgi:paraquat-inducible protein A
LVCLAIACSFPFLSFKSKGFESVMTLPQTAGGIWDAGMPEIAVVVASFMMIIPAAVMVLLLTLATCMAQGWYFPWMMPLSRLVFRLQNWAMVDVFVIGVLVSLTKIAGMATVVIGISFWGYGAFAVFFVLAMSSLDTLQYWNQLERLYEASHAS